MQWITSLIVTSMVALQPAPANGPATSPTTGPDDEVEALIVQLGDDDWRRRQAAQDRLVLMSGEVQHRLERAARDAADPEVRALAEAALARIADNAETGPSIITIRGDDLPLREVVRQLSEQARAPLEVYPPDVLDQPRNANVSLDIDHLPFWDAMRHVSEKTGFSLQQWDNTGVKLMQGGQHSEGIGQVSGAYLISAVRVSRSRSMELGGGQNVYEDFNVQLSARAEPKLRLLRVSYMPNIDEAVDEHGHSLLPAEHVQQPGGFTHAPAGAWQLTARLAAPANMGRRIARLKGSIDVSIQTRSEQLEISDILSAPSTGRVAGGVRFTVRELRKIGEAWSLDLVIRPDGILPDEWLRMQQVLSMADMTLLDERGRAFGRSGYSTSGGAERIEMSIEFTTGASGRNAGKIGEPAKLVWTVPTATREVSVPFEFKDLPIP